MIGAILGDVIGSPYEFDMGEKTKDFPFFDWGCEFTDDTVMTVAVAEALLDVGAEASVEEIQRHVIHQMHRWGKKYPDAGYGGRFAGWLYWESTTPYNSYGNGSAMRVSAVGWLYDSLERTLEVAEATAAVTHNHPEGIKGAQATAATIFKARNGESKEAIRDYIEETFGYDLHRTCEEIRPNYRHVESCMETVPEAIIAFLEGNDFEDVIRTAVSLGGDCDTLTAIAGSIAEAYYDVPEELIKEAMSRIPQEIRDVVERFWGRVYGPDEELEELLVNVPRSYRDFVIGIQEYMDTYERKNAMLEYLRNNKNLTVSEIIKKSEEIASLFPSDYDNLL